MSLAKKKNLAWALSVLGFGGAYFFFFICSAERFPDEWVYYCWPVIAAAVSAISFLKVRAYYRVEPPPPPGQLRLQLIDLIALTFAFAMSMAIVQSTVKAEKFAAMGPLLSFLVVALLTGGFLSASLRGIFASRSRFLYAFIHALRSFGWMGLGALLSTCIFLCFARGPKRMFDFIVRTFGWESGFAGPNEEMLFNFLRLGLLFWAIGTLAIRQFIRRYEIQANS